MQAPKITSQIRKGILQGMVLMILDHQPSYGYGLSQALDQQGLSQVPKGTIYPLLTKLEKNGLITNQMVKSPSGPPRKYYSITESGQRSKKEFIQLWQPLATAVNNLIQEEQSHENKKAN
jgi:PadR family transcriptional regulator, regulatory protein PadR